MAEIQHQMDSGRLLDDGLDGLAKGADVRLFEYFLVRKGYDCSLIFILNTDTRLNRSHNGLPIRINRNAAILSRIENLVKFFAEGSSPDRETGRNEENYVKAG